MQVVVRVAPRDLYNIPEAQINPELGLLPNRNVPENVLVIVRLLRLDMRSIQHVHVYDFIPDVMLTMFM